MSIIISVSAEKKRQHSRFEYYAVEITLLNLSAPGVLIQITAGVENHEDRRDDSSVETKHRLGGVKITPSVD